ncbi:hypothetical protein JHK87_034210 [Glycine soja]|nr:hypothetical protein JHK87_034210 [Glycine soja]
MIWLSQVEGKGGGAQLHLMESRNDGSSFGEEQGGLHRRFPPDANHKSTTDPTYTAWTREEAQREIIVNCIPSLNSNIMAFAVNSTTKNTTNDKCYKLVGYPPNYFKNKPQHTVNQATDYDESSSQGATNNLSTAQCQQLISFLTNQLKTENIVDTLATNVSDLQNCLGKREPLPNWHYTSPNFANPRRPHVTLTLIPVPFLVTIFIRPRHATPLIKRGRFPVENVLVQFRAGEHAANAVINLNTFYAG